MLQKKEKDRPSILDFLQAPIIKKRAISYLKEVYDKLVADNGDKELIEIVNYQAKNLGISLQDKAEPMQRKTKPEFTAERLKQDKKKLKQQL